MIKYFSQRWNYDINLQGTANLSKHGVGMRGNYILRTRYEAQGGGLDMHVH